LNRRLELIINHEQHSEIRLREHGFCKGAEFFDSVSREPLLGTPGTLRIELDNFYGSRIQFKLDMKLLPRLPPTRVVPRTLKEIGLRSKSVVEEFKLKFLNVGLDLITQGQLNVHVDVWLRNPTNLPITLLRVQGDLYYNDPDESATLPADRRALIKKEMAYPERGHTTLYMAPQAITKIPKIKVGLGGKRQIGDMIALAARVKDELIGKGRLCVGATKGLITLGLGGFIWAQPFELHSLGGGCEMYDDKTNPEYANPKCRSAYDAASGTAGVNVYQVGAITLASVNHYLPLLPLSFVPSDAINHHLPLLQNTHSCDLRFLGVLG
jgi:hypothetical protein